MENETMLELFSFYGTLHFYLKYLNVLKPVQAKQKR